MLPVVALTAAVAGFISSGAYYTILQGPLAAARTDSSESESPRWTYAVEFARTLVIAAVVTGVAYVSGIESWLSGITLGLALWVGFPLMLWMGAILHEGTNPRLAVIHTGDWLFKLAIIGAIVGAWS